MGDVSNPVPLPPGWDCKYDPRTSRYYFINYYTKTTTWDDPRLRHQQFQSPNTALNRVTGVGETTILQEINKTGSSLNRNSVRNSHVDTSATTNNEDTEQLVSKIGSIFPTVSETHIRLLLKKYMKSIFPSVEETVLLDVLASNENNVQKASEVLLEMGYEKKEIKPPKLHERRTAEQKSETDAQKVTEQPTTVRIKTAEEKVKMKEKLHEEYPNLPEQIINLALDSVNYNIHRANQILQIMVQEDNKLRVNNTEDEDKEEEEVVESTSTDDRQTTDESECDTVANVKTLSEPLFTTTTKADTGTTTAKNLNKFWRHKNKNSNAKISREVSIEKDMEEYKSSCLLQPVGPNIELQRGPNDDLLLPDYTIWNGANPNLVNGRNLSNAKGPNKGLILTSRCQAKGPNADIRKGPVFGLAKGSMYSQIKLVLNETR